MAAASGTTKRGLERGEEKRGDPIWEKRRKCNFLEEEEDADEPTAMAAVGSKRVYESATTGRTPPTPRNCSAGVDVSPGWPLSTTTPTASCRRCNPGIRQPRDHH
jgi:hypothetical protein